MLTIDKTNTENPNYIYLNSRLTEIVYSSQMTNSLHYVKNHHILTGDTLCLDLGHIS